MQINTAGPEMQKIVVGRKNPLSTAGENGEEFSACLAELLLCLGLDTFLMAGVCGEQVPESKNPETVAAPEPASSGSVPEGVNAAPEAAIAMDNGTTMGTSLIPEGFYPPGRYAFFNGPFQDGLKGMEPALNPGGEGEASPAFSAPPGLPQEKVEFNPFTTTVAPPLSGEDEPVPEGAGTRFILDPPPVAEDVTPPALETVTGKSGSGVPGKEIPAGLVEDTEPGPELDLSGRPDSVMPGGGSRPEAAPWLQGTGDNRPAAVNQLRQSVLEQLNARLAFLPEKGSFPAEIRLQLNPPELGEVVISVAAKRGKMAVEIVTEGALVREVFEASLGELKQRFQQLNLAVDRIDVFTAEQFLDQGGRFHRDSGFPDRVWGFGEPGGKAGEEVSGMPEPANESRFRDLPGSGIEFWA